MLHLTFCLAVKQLEQSKSVADPRVAALQEEVRGLQEQLASARSAHETELAKVRAAASSSSSPGGKDVAALKKQIATLEEEKAALCETIAKLKAGGDSDLDEADLMKEENSE